MAIFLVQHGVSLPKDKDPEKGLSDQGRKETLTIAQVAQTYEIQVSQIFHSGKKRARQTAEIFDRYLTCGKTPATLKGINPMDDVKEFAKAVDPLSNAMVVGHLPFMEKLVSFLTAGREDIRVYRFQNSGIVCLDRDESGWFIKWTLNPNIS